MSARLALLAFAMTPLAGPVSGQAPAPAAPPQYEVEVIVFANRDFDPTEEQFDQSLEALPEAGFGLPLSPPVFDESMFAVGPAPGAETPAPITNELGSTADTPLVPFEDPLLVRPLRADELKLGNEYRRLRAVSAYTPLLHVGWVQPGLPEDEATPFDLATIGTINPRGTIRVHLSRFLHVTLDLTYQRADAVPAAANAATELAELSFAPRYRLRTTRNVRSGELHYFDHPAFGVLVRVSPRAAPEVQPGRRPAA